MLIKSLVCLAFALPILIVPKSFYDLFGMTLDAAGVFPAWQYGASLLGNFLLTWFSRFSRETKARKAIIRGMLVYNLTGLVITLITVLRGVTNALGWLPVGIYLFFTIGYGYFLLNPPSP
jgi:hypothetical protein